MNYKYLTVIIIGLLLSLSIVCASDNSESQYEKTQSLELDNEVNYSNFNNYHINDDNNEKPEKYLKNINKKFENKTIKTDDEPSQISLNVSATDIKYGDTANITGTLKNNTISLTQQEITLLVNDDEYTTTTDENGEYTFCISEYNIGSNEVMVFYDDETDFIYNITSFTVRKLNTTTRIINNTGIVYQNIIECAIVTDEINYVVNEGFVTFIIKNQVIGTADVINGLAILNFVYNTSINDTIQAIYSGSDIYNPSNSSQVIVIYKQYTNIILSPVFCSVKDTVAFTAHILDEDSNNVSSGKCVLKINGQTMKDENGKVIYNKVNNGISSFNVTLPATLVGIHNYTFVYSGSTAYNGSRATNTLIIYKRNYTVNLNITPNSTKRGCTINLTTTINTPNITINGGKVILKLNGLTIKDENGTPIQLNVTNNNAEVLYTIPESLSIGEKTIKAVYIDELCDRYETESTFTIQKKDIYIVLEEIKYYPNKLIIKANIFNEFNQTINRNLTYAIKLNGLTQLISNTDNSIINVQINNTYNDDNYTLSIVIGENTGYNAYTYTSNVSLYLPKVIIENDEIYRCDNNTFTLIIPEEYINQNNSLQLYLDDSLLLNTTNIAQNITTENYIPIFYEGNHSLYAIITNETNQNIIQTTKNITVNSHYIYVNSNGDINSEGDAITNPTTLEKAINITSDNQIILLSTLTDDDTYLMNNKVLSSETNLHKLNIIGQTDKTIIFDGNNTNYCMYIPIGMDVTFSNVKFINGYNDILGGVFINEGNLTIINSTISDNHAYEVGGAIINTGNLTLLNNMISNNSVLNDSYYYDYNNSTTNSGGVIYSFAGNIILINNTVNNNSCCYGGVISTYNSSISSINNTFSNNNAKYTAGVLYFYESLDIQFNNLFVNNTAIIGSVQDSINSLDYIYDNNYIQNNGTKYGVLNLVNSTTIVYYLT
ncbi:MAG: hypothetical protein IJJ11_00440 [Methanosphaera sp.]|nr:hypothetical protein [Methanosphaera sp.]